MSGGEPTSRHEPFTDLVFVMGMYGSGVPLMGDVLTQLGLLRVDKTETSPLCDFNDELLRVGGGSKDQLPRAAPGELAWRLRSHYDKARQLWNGTVGSPESDGARTSWVWADPRHSMLASFWAAALELKPAVVLIHRDPATLSVPGDLEVRSFDEATENVVAQWDRYSRAALVQLAQWPSAVIRYESLLGQPKEQVHLVSEFLEACGIVLEVAGIEQAVDSVETQAQSISLAPSEPILTVQKQQRVLDRILEDMDGLHIDPAQWTITANIESTVAEFYDEEYYGVSYDQSGVPYSRSESVWVNLFDAMAHSIATSLQPNTVLDVGCATGMLVEGLRKYKVDARGIDISPWAIQQCPDSLRPFCSVGDITEELEGTYELITCSEVVEHLPPFLADEAIANLCRHSDVILFSSTADDFDEPTHLNVEPSGYWARLFHHHGFIRDIDYDASYFAPHAILFRRREADADELITNYERAIENVTSALGTRLADAVAEHDRLAERFNSFVADHRPVAEERDALRADLLRASDENAVLRVDVVELEKRRSAEVLAAHDAISEFERGQLRLSQLVTARETELENIRQTKTFRYTTSLRRIYGRLRRPLAAPVVSPEQASLGEAATADSSSYDLWIQQFDTIDDGARAAIRGRLDQLSDQPLVSVIMPVYNTPARYLSASIESVLGQIYSNWELCIADDCSTEPHVGEILGGYAARDSRIRVVMRPENGHISAASNTALEMAAGTWIAPFDHDDVLAEHALGLAVLALAAHPDAGLLYSDEDKIDDAGRRQDPYFKPEFDPLLLMGQNYLTHLSLLRRDLVLDAGGYREGFEGSQDWDLVLRVSEALEPEQVVHVPHVLYHWRKHAESTASVLSAKPYAVGAGQRAVVEHLKRRGLSGDVSGIALSGHNRVRWHLPDPAPLVSIIIPTKDGRLLQRCVDSVLSFTTYPNFEILIVDNGSQQLATLDYLRVREGQLTVMRDDRPFNYSALNNAAVLRTSGDIICLLNDDTEVIGGDWLDELVGELLQPGVGAAGAKLCYPDGRIQHAGVILGIGGVAGHSHRFFDRLAPGHFGRLLMAQNVSAVTGACMVVRREAWTQVGGLDEVNLAVAFNDVDFGMRLRQAGWRIVWTPDAELFHHESVSRGPDTVDHRVLEFGRETRYVQRHWGAALRNDPAYNPNLSLVTEDFALAWPPRVSYR